MTSLALIAQRSQRESDADVVAVGLSLGEDSEFGESNVDERLFGGSVRLPIASVTKPIVASLLLDLVADGLIRLDEPLGVCLPPGQLARAVPAALTLRHVLQHTSGLHPDLPDLDRFADASGAANDAVTRHERRFRPGAAWEYSNTGYWLAGIAAETVGSAPLEKALEDRILRRLAMTDTSFDPGAGGGIAGAPAETPYPPAGRAAGGLLSTTVDLLRFARAQFENASRFASIAQGVGTVPTRWGSRYGLGWEVEERSRATVLSHNGGWGQYVARLVVVPARSLAVAAIARGGRPALVSVTEQLLLDRAGIGPTPSSSRRLTFELARSRFVAARMRERGGAITDLDAHLRLGVDPVPCRSMAMLTAQPGRHGLF